MCKSCDPKADTNPVAILTWLGGFFHRRSVKKLIAEKQPGRNESCPCGRGHKYKRCPGEYRANA